MPSPDRASQRSPAVPMVPADSEPTTKKIGQSPLTVSEMLREVDFSQQCFQTNDTLVTQMGMTERIRFFSDCKFQRYLREANLSDPDFWELYAMRGRSAVVNHLLINSFAWGYDNEYGKEIRVRCYFGRKGCVIEVEDFGKGFDANALFAAHAAGKLDEGLHFHHRGIGLMLFIKGDRYDIRVDSSTTPPTGTKVAVMYMYTQLPNAQPIHSLPTSSFDFSQRSIVRHNS